MRPTLIVIVLVASSSCIPNAARKNARLSKGIDVDLTGAANVLLEGKDGSGAATDARAVAHFELDAQWATTSEDNSGFAIQLKVPLNFFFSALDLYYEMPSQGSAYYGFGAELGLLNALYGTVTLYDADDKNYITFTQRVLSNILEDGERYYQINPQLTLGHAGDQDLSVFIAYAYQTGRGIDVDIDLFTDENNLDLRKNYMLAGGSIRF